MKGGQSHAKADDRLSMKKKAPETKEEKKAFMELIELSDSEEESGDPCYSHSGNIQPFTFGIFNCFQYICGCTRLMRHNQAEMMHSKSYQQIFIS